MVEDVVTPNGPYRLRLMSRSSAWRDALPTAPRPPPGRGPTGRLSCGPRRGEPRACPLHARAARRHGRLPPPLRARSTPRSRFARVRRLPAAASRDRHARGAAGGVRPADRGEPGGCDRALDPASARKPRSPPATPSHSSPPSTSAAAGSRPRAPRRSSASFAPSIWSDSAGTTPTSSCSGSAASGASAPGRLA